MFVSNPSPSVTPQFVISMSGAITSQITSSSGVSQGVLDATGAALASQISVLSGSSVIDGVLVTTTNGPATRLIIDTYNSANQFGSSVRGRRARGDINTPSGLQANDTLLQLVGDGNNGTGFVTARASITLVATDTWTTESTPTRISMRTTPSGATASIERVRIGPNGNVGIDNDNPQYTLDISGALNVTQGLYVNGVPITGGGVADTTQAFVTAVPTGVTSLAITYVSPYVSIPFVSSTLASTGIIIYQMVVQQITVSGYLAIFSDTITENGVTVNTYAKL